MKWSYPIFRIFGIQVRLHGTFLILLLFILIPVFNAKDSLPIFFAMLFISYFFIILLHELGHSLVAMRFGSKVRDITLLPIGGMARIEKLPEKPSQEILVAFAGPAVNIIFVLIIWLILGDLTVIIDKISEFFDSSRTLTNPSVYEFLVYLGAFNIFVALFNLLPGFPMDGGRILRGSLSFFMLYEKATILAVRIGRLVALVFTIFALVLIFESGEVFQGIILLIISMFLSRAGAAEAKNAVIKGLLRGVKLEERMLRHPSKIDINLNLHEVERIMAISYQQVFPVVDNGYLVGFLTRDLFFQTLQQQGYNAQMPFEPAIWVMPGVDFFTLLLSFGEKKINYIAVTDWFGRFLGIFNSNDANNVLKEQLEKKQTLSLYEQQLLMK